MKKITIAFDCDGTLINNIDEQFKEKTIIANERIRSLLIIFASMKNVRIVVWSGAGELWARQVAAAIGINQYVDQFASKNHLGKGADGKHIFNPDIPKPDIAIDDIHACELGDINLIVREK